MEMRAVNNLEKMFRDELKDKLNMTKYYTDASLLQYAFRFIPYEELKVKATIRLSLLDGKETDVSLEDCILLELLHWFKHSFFTWMDVPKCGSCNETTANRGTLPPNQSESMSGARRVEHFVCPKCEKSIRFPRYNDPRKLLATRTGRCGEWANCFTLLCFALEYEARIVIDWTDHVWTEVYSQSRHKWLHCDPCENVCDKPLMYEVGWKKKLSYVIAFSPIEVQDVTWRYTANFGEVMMRRNRCREEFLLDCIKTFQWALEESLDNDAKTTLHYHRLMELADFLTPAMQDDESYDGRTSGSLAWRLARGEMEDLSKQNSYIFKLCAFEVEMKHLHVKYSCASDKYIRIRNHSSGETENWSTCAFSYSNIFRKVENDWRMVYLARTEGSPRGTIAWKFDCEGCGLVINELKLHVCSETFESGKLTWILYPNSHQTNPKVYSADNVNPLHTREFRGCTSLLLSAEFTGGSGANAWQHSQLFRQSLDSTMFPFEVQITFIRKFYETTKD